MTETPATSISEVTRRRIIDSVAGSWSGNIDEVDFLQRLYDLDSMPSHDGRFTSAAGDIYKHRIMNYDWSEDWVFTDSRFRILRGTDEAFLKFICETVHPAVRDTTDAETLVKAFNIELGNDGWALAPTREISGRPVYEARRRAGPSRFDVAISFAGTERQYANQLAERVSGAGYAIFYDDFYPDTLWGKDLFEFFDEIYRKRARYCVMFVSKDYAERMWTTHERRSAQARALEKNGEYILPIKVDDTDLPGLPPTIGYLSIDVGIDRISEILIKKLQS